MNITKKSNFIDSLIKKHNKYLVIKIAIIIPLAILVVIYSQGEQAKQTMLEQQKNYINSLEIDLTWDEDEVKRLTEELDQMNKKLDYYNSISDTESYNALIPEYNQKVEMIRDYKKKYDEYVNQIDDYNSKL